MNENETKIGELREQLAGLQRALDSLNTELPVDVAPRGVVGRDGGEAQAEFDAGSARMKQLELRSKFSKMSPAELSELIDIQASQEGGKQAESGLLNHLATANPAIAKLLDVSGGSALVRQDLEPLLYATFVRRFPFWARVRKEPANGLVHAYNQITGVGGATYITDTGTVADDVSTYFRKTSNIAVAATRRGITLKQQFAIQQGGAGYSGLGVELQGGVTALTKTIQTTIFQGNFSDNVSAGAATEKGAYDANAHDGFRILLGATGTGNPVILEKGNLSYIAAINSVVASTLDNGGSPSAVVMTPPRYAEWVNELISFVREAPGSAGAQGLDFSSIITAAGTLPIVTVPGTSFGSYTSGVPKQDIYVLDEETVSVPWLGSDSITTLEIPIGVAGALTRLYIMFVMTGLAVKVPSFNAKVRVNI